MAKAQLNFGELSGGGLKIETGTFTAQNITVTASTLKEIRMVSVYYPQSPSADTVAYVDDNGNFHCIVEHTGADKITDINGNQFSFTWDSSNTFNWVAVGV